MMVILERDISFLDFDNNEINFKAGVSVYVDIDRHIAFCDGIHFDICEEEYFIEQ